ncbi:MAG: arylsulfatase [Planctomycetota bacterium]|nr:MAG: arylsulfatase [Planctomycetota bacterium]
MCIVGLTFLALVATALYPARAAEPPRPNVVFILADDLGFSDLGCYGGEIDTPNLDRLAEGGLRFTNFYNTARCWPSRAALMTGYYAQQVRRDVIPGANFGSRAKRPDWAPLLPAMLKPLGYRTYHSGKWHLDGKALPAGFDHSYILDDHNRFFAPKNHKRDDEPLPPVEADENYYATTAIADHALACLDEHAREHAAEPFFAYVAFTCPHFPLHALQEDIDRYRERYLAGWNKIQQERGERLAKLGIVEHKPPAMERKLGPPYEFPGTAEALGSGEVFYPIAWEELTDEQRVFQAQKMAIHAAMVDRMDREVGRIVSRLKAMGVLDNTLILFASDNGASAEIMVRGDGHDMAAPFGSAATFLCLGPGWSSAANTPFRRHKTWVHEGGISTPLVAHWPQGIEAKGELRHTPAHLIDIVPTVLELAGGSPPETWNGKKVPPAPGKSLVPALAGDVEIQRDDLWWFHDGHRAIRVGDWKAVSDGSEAPWELYNLARDRGETHNLAGQEPEKLSQLKQAWNEHLDEYRELATRDLQKN